MCFRIANLKELAKLKKMKIISCILLLIVASGCSSTDGVNRLKKAVFNLPWGSNTAIVNLDSVQTVHELNELYCKKAQSDATFRLVLPYNMHTCQLQQDAPTGIAVMGAPMKCWIARSGSYAFRFELEGQRWLANGEIFDFTKMDSLVALNILNNGYDPSLSENPRKAVFEISAKGDTSIRTLTQIFDALTTSYTRLLDQKSKEYESIDSLAKDYPLHIIVAEKTKIPPMDITLQKEIEEQIELDLD